ncbi:TetR/AcrR family transcriptional regulator [Amycolatopsis sp. 195334CR]|uniref:TetR/AcrR family transcriptional regulator n=1 Tax=Amycolatopsis sp. 195334CR TaxID=2814588 RepID=UPI001A8ECF80|nr:TetR/AcrR family transcriptional regulator [Amycolatopsis sp. 195334CR]MBN6039645.1 helix-turn-helix transcriptional regulator [Amycolatopsis sp. 195334CR]
MSTPRSRREQYSDATRTALLAAATARFAEHGYAATTLEDVAADIQATRGAVYHHFANKTALFEAVVEELQIDLVRRITEAAAGMTDPWEVASRAVGVFLDRCCDPVYGRVVWQEAPVAFGFRRWLEFEEKYAYGLIERLVRAMLETSEGDALPGEPMSRLTFHLLGGAGLALAETAEPDKPRVKAEYQQVVLRMLGR